jgi:uncharacterized protein (DUF433 family)
MATPYSPGTNGIPSPVFMKLSEEYLTALAQAVGDSKEKVEKVIYEMLDAGILEYQKDIRRTNNLAVTYSARNRVQERLQIRIMNYLLGYKLTEFTHIVKADVTAENEPVIVGTRIPVYFIVSALMNGKSIEQLHAQYPEISRQAILDAIHYYLHHQSKFDSRFEENK